MSRCTVSCVALVAASLWLAAPAAGRPPIDGAFMGRPPMFDDMPGEGPGVMLPLLLKHADLTADQQAQIHKIMEAARPMAWFGLALSCAARIRSRRPARIPVLWGPRMPLPPLTATRSAPPRRYRKRFSRGGIIEAASTSTGTPRACAIRHTSSNDRMPGGLVNGETR